MGLSSPQSTAGYTPLTDLSHHPQIPKGIMSSVSGKIILIRFGFSVGAVRVCRDVIEYTAVRKNDWTCNFTMAFII